MVNSCRVFCGREVLCYMLQLVLRTAATTANATADASLDWSLFLAFFILMIGCIKRNCLAEGIRHHQNFPGQRWRWFI